MEETEKVIIREKTKSLVGIKIFVFLAFIGLGISGFVNYYLYTQLQSLNYQIERVSEYTDEFHKNLYARVNSTYSDGSHILSISDVYYRKHFDSSDKE